MTAEKNSLSNARTHKVIKLIPPDGGWGWMVIVGTALSNIFNQSMLSLFGLLYGDALEAMGHETKGASIVLSTMLFVTNFGGPIAGAIQKLTSSRFVAVLGACSCTAGIFFSGFATNIVHLIFSYGILLGLGLGFIQNASFVTINNYFKLKKSRAVGLANVGTGIGQTLMPHLVTILLSKYGFNGTCLILAGLSLNGICGTMLLQPVEWHMKKVEEDVMIDEKINLLQEKHKDIVVRKDSIINVLKKDGRRATEPDLIIKNGNRRPIDWNDRKSHSYRELNASKNSKSYESDVNGNIGSKKYIADPEPKKSIFRKIYELFDLSLLLSPRFINILIGTALSVTSIQNFSMLYPMFLQKTAMMTKQETANCMSAVAAADIMGRLILPIFQDKYKIKARWMLIMTSVWLIVVRQILAYQSDLLVLMTMSCLYGFGRSMIIVARNIAISDTCKKEQVPAAVGLGMFTMSIIVPPAGYFLGWLRDYTGSYITTITAQNVLLIILLATWIPDMILLHMQEKRQKKDVELMQMS